MISSFLSNLKGQYGALPRFEQLEYKRTLIFFGIMLLCYIVLTIKVLSDELYELATINGICIGLYLYASFLAILKTGKLKHAVVLISFSNFVAIVAHTFFYGTDSGIQMLMWPFACLFAMNSNINVKQAQLAFALSIITFIGFQFLVRNHNGIEFFPHSSLFFLGVSGALILLEIDAIKRSMRNKRKKLKRLANKDSLTDLHNRRFFTTFLNYQLNVAEREKRSFTLAMGDIDHFKAINDTHGHDVGDTVLQAVAGCFSSYLGQNDLACRWGGEEFLIYLPESKAEHAEPVIEAVASVLRDTKINDISITMSFGLVESDGKESLDSILKRVDKLLYQAKAMGRDNVQTILHKEP